MILILHWQYVKQHYKKESPKWEQIAYQSKQWFLIRSNGQIIPATTCYILFDFGWILRLQFKSASTSISIFFFHDQLTEEGYHCLNRLSN